MALPTANPKSKLQVFAAQEFVTETARNDYNVNSQFTINSIPLVKGVDLGTPVDQQERTTEIARNEFNINNQYGLNDVS